VVRKGDENSTERNAPEQGRNAAEITILLIARSRYFTGGHLNKRSGEFNRSVGAVNLQSALASWSPVEK
jgi:hypothetical protein